MAAQICRRCERLLEQDDLIKGEVVARFVALKSKRAYAMTKPLDCLWLEHLSCNDPRGDHEETIDE